jgi:hypothetical protein
MADLARLPDNIPRTGRKSNAVAVMKMLGKRQLSLRSLSAATRSTSASAKLRSTQLHLR